MSSIGLSPTFIHTTHQTTSVQTKKPFNGQAQRTQLAFGKGIDSFQRTNKPSVKFGAAPEEEQRRAEQHIANISSNAVKDLLNTFVSGNKFKESPTYHANKITQLPTNIQARQVRDHFKAWDEDPSRKITQSGE